MALTLLFDKLKPAVKSKLNQGLGIIDKTAKHVLSICNYGSSQAISIKIDFLNKNTQEYELKSLLYLLIEARHSSG